MPRLITRFKLDLIHPLLMLFGLLTIVPSHNIFGGAPGPIHPSPQKLSAVVSRGADEKDVRSLEKGKSIKRELLQGQQHTYRINLSAIEFLKVIVEQQGIDAVVQVLGPDGKQILEFDSESRKQGQESITLVSEVAGDYLLIVRHKQKMSAQGDYEIRIEELRAATDDDGALHQARKSHYGGLKLSRAGKYDEAIPLLECALETRERILGPNHPDVAAVINSLGGIYWYKGDYVKAEPLFQRALSIRENALGSEHLDVATSLNNFALLCREKGNYTEAESLIQRSLEIREKALGSEHPDVATSLDNLAIIARLKGNYAKAETLNRRAIDIMEKTQGPEHPDTGQMVNSLGNLYYFKGDYVKAEPLFQRALTIKKKNLGPEHRAIVISIHNLANLYYSKGDYAQAELLYKRALVMAEKTLSPEHPFVADTLGNLALVYLEKKDLMKAESLFQRSLVIKEKTLGLEHPRVAASCNNLGLLYYERGDFAKAEPLFQRSQAIREKTQGPDHPDVAIPLHNLANLYHRANNYAKAEKYHQLALSIREKALGAQHPDVAASLNELAILNIAKGDITQAIALQSHANAISEHNLALNLSAGSERQRLAYLATLSDQTDRTISLHLRYAQNDPSASRLAATLILQRKARALDATSEYLNALRNRFNEEDRALLDRLTETRAQIAKLVVDGPQRMTTEQYQDQVKTLEDQAEKFESEISRRSNEFLAQSLPITLATVRAAIPDDAALIEFASYRPFNHKAIKEEEAYGRPRYLAYVMRRHGEVQWSELGEVKAIDDAIAKLRNALRDPKRKDAGKLARAVDRKVFQPLRPLVGELTRLLISPDGSLNLIPFEALVDENGRYLVERYSISYLASGRDLLRLQVARESRSGPLVIADPDFGDGLQIGATRSLRQRNGRRMEQAKGTVFSQFYFPSLPYTAEEGEALRALLPGATLLTRRLANKAALSHASSPALLHIATHGFFLEDLNSTSMGERRRRESVSGASRRLKQIKRIGARIENPLLRAGLALAGANEQKNGDNGILTALEMTGLNLWGTKLVTLSACDTGVGEVRNGDGVHGLRRALTLAGSETQVMSLWPVSDRWTQALMVSYYRRLRRGEGRGEALRQVQLEMLKNAKRRHPYYWASFIQSGEWANLDGNSK